VLGGFFGAKMAGTLPNAVLKKVFGAVLPVISARMILTR